MRFMAPEPALFDILLPGTREGAALQHRPWNSARLLSRGLASVERFLAQAGFDRAPWLAVAFGGGIAAWFLLPSQGHWLALLAGCGAMALGVVAGLRRDGAYPLLRLALVSLLLVFAAGCASVWLRSTLVGAQPIPASISGTFTARVLSVESQPARDRERVVLAMREPGTARAIRVRVNVPAKIGEGTFDPGALVRVRMRLMPPAPPMLPGAYDFARSAWFQGLAATGTVIAPPEVLAPGTGRPWLREMQDRVTSLVRERLGSETGGIGAALAAGDVGAIAEEDAQAMRDSGLAHLLSISGLHVSAVIGAVYVLALRLLALWPWLTLRVRLPLVAAGAGALAGIGYTLLSGAQVPTVRSCIGALLVLAALALGREALSLRMLAIAAFLVLLLWPEALAGPSFQMSFAAVLAIVALAGAEPIRRFLGPREEGLPMRALRQLGMILLTGIVIELALMPIGLHHFHRAGVYGALANIIAIPLTTLVVMPAVLAGLLLDVIGAGLPAWWVADRSIALLLALAHWFAAQPGAVTAMPAMGGGAFALFVAGGLWLGLWRGRTRWWGLAPALAGAASLALLQPPDVLVSGDGRHVGLTDGGGAPLMLLRQTRSDFALDNLTEIAGGPGETMALDRAPGTRCNPDVCVAVLRRGERDWLVLLTRTRDAVPERALAAACERVDLVISDRWLPRSCRPRWLKLDRRMLQHTGGVTVELEGRQVRTVAEGQGRHGWWRWAADSASASR